MSTWTPYGVLQQALGSLFAPEQQPLNVESLISTINPNADPQDKAYWRDWRKQHGLSKQEMRNLRAQALLGSPAPSNVSRRDLKRIEGTRTDLDGPNIYNRGVVSAENNVNTLTNFFNNNAEAIAAYNSKGVEVPIKEIEVPEGLYTEPEEEPVIPVTPKTITYDWAGSGLNSYWLKQNQMVLDGLSDTLKLEISGGDGIISAEDARAWQNKIGAGSDLKFGQNTISAMNNSYKTSYMQDYKNPVTKNGNPVLTTAAWEKGMSTKGYRKEQLADGTHRFIDSGNNIFYNNGKMWDNSRRIMTNYNMSNFITKGTLN